MAEGADDLELRHRLSDAALAAAVVAGVTVRDLDTDEMTEASALLAEVWRTGPRESPMEPGLLDGDAVMRKNVMTALYHSLIAPSVTSDIDGRWAHRVVNTGDAPLVFFVTWLSDCGHEYGTVAFPDIRL